MTQNDAVKILLLDSHSLLNRAFYALPLLSNSKGVPTNAVFGYFSMLARLIADYHPTHIGAVFDMKAPTFRHNMYAGYKANRHPMPEELAVQVPILHTLLEKLGIKILEMPGYEADDILGTIAKRFQVQTLLVSGDKDVWQLVDDTTTVLYTKRGVTDLYEYTPETLRETGLSAAQVVEYKGLRGDTADNIPGAPGIGEKTARTLLEHYASVEGVYAHLSELKGKLAKTLEENREQVELSLRLARIDTAVPIACELKDLAYHGATPAFLDALQELECKSLIPRFHTANAEERGQQADDAPVLPAFVTTEITSREQLRAVLPTEATDIAWLCDKECAFSFDGVTQYVTRFPETLFDQGLSEEEVWEELAPYMQAERVKKHVFDVKTLLHSGKTLAEPYEDVLLKAYLSDSNRIPKTAMQLLADRGVEEGGAAALLWVSQCLDRELEEKGLTALYRDLELKLIPVLYDMEVAGICVDEEVLGQLSQRYRAEIDTLVEEIYRMAGERFNLNSPKQLGEVLFEKMGLNPSKKNKTRTGYSVSAEVLEELDHPIALLLLRYRNYQKLQSTYLDGLRPLIGKDGKLHTVFHQCLTATGRLSSSDPNLQNIPVRREEGKEIRKMLVASPGNLLVTADYSQIELRLLAHFSQDPVLVEGYRNGADIHALTAAKLYGIPPEQVTPQMRRSAKAVNFGIIYGISAFGLAKNVGLHPGEAARFQEKYFQTYPAVKSYMESNVQTAKEQGYIRTLLGRIRYFPELASPNRNVRAFGERAAMNMPLQGSAADLIKLAMLRVYDRLRAEGLSAKLVLQVHDELIVDTPLAEVERVKRILQQEMEGAYALHVPLIAEANAGQNWLEAK